MTRTGQDRVDERMAAVAAGAMAAALLDAAGVVPGALDGAQVRRRDDEGGLEETVDEAVRDYIDAIPSGHRALFDRLHRLILSVYPDAAVALSYKMPTYKVGSGRLHVGTWKHGISVYGWKQGGDAGFTARHPELRTSTGTIRLRPEDAAAIPDGEFRDLVRSALGPGRKTVKPHYSR